MNNEEGVGNLPPYFSMDCSFDNRRIKPDFVKNVYSLIFQNGFTFKSGYTKYDKLPLYAIASNKRTKKTRLLP